MTTWLVAALLLRVCLLATHPFYEARDVIRDDRVVGVYADETTGLRATVTPGKAPGRYRAALQENGSSAVYAITLFRIGRRTFADITSEHGPAPARADANAPTSAALNHALANGRHAVVAVAPAVDGTSLWSPLPDSLAALWLAEPHLHRTTLDDTAVMLTDPTKPLRALLARHGQDQTVFAQELWLAKAR